MRVPRPVHVLAASPTETPPRKGRDLPTDHPTHTARPHSGHERAPSPRPLLAPPCGRTESGGSGSAELCVAPASGALLRGTRRSREEGQSGRSQRCGVGLTLVASLLGELGALLASASSVLVPASPPLGQLPAARPPRARASETPEPWDPQGHALSCQQTDPPGRAPGRGQAHTPRAVQGNVDHGPRVAPPASGDIALRGATSGIAERTGSDGRLPLDMGFP